MGFPYAAAAVGASSIADVIAQILGGQDSARRAKKLFGYAEDLYNLPESEYTKGVSKDTGYAMEALGGQLQGDANRIGSRLGLDSGAAQQAIAQNTYSTRAGIFTDFQAEARRRRQQDRLSALNIMGSAI